MKRYRLTESNLRNMIRECIEDALYEGKAPEFANNNELYRIANDGDMRRGGKGQRRSFPITKNWDDPEYADTARTKSGREFNLRKESKARDAFNKAVKYGKKQLNKFNQSIKDLTDEYDEDGNPIVDNPMYKGKKSNNESRLRNMIREAIEEAFNPQQYAYMAGVAANRANSMKAAFNPQYAARKKRQMELFGNAATGRTGGNGQNLMNNGGQYGEAIYSPNSNYGVDIYRNNFNGDNKKGNAFNIKHSQFNNDGSSDDMYGNQHGQTMNNTQYRQELMQNDPNYIQNLNQASSVTLGNLQLNKAFNQGRQQKQIDRQTMRDMGQGNTPRRNGINGFH